MEESSSILELSSANETLYINYTNEIIETSEDREDGFVYWLAVFLSDLGALIELIIVIFLFHEFCRKKSSVKSAYFFIMSLGFVVDIMVCVMSTIGDIINWNLELWIMKIISLVLWYGQFSIGAWNAILGFNRCTALAFPVLHQKVGILVPIIYTNN